MTNVPSFKDELTRISNEYTVIEKFKGVLLDRARNGYRFHSFEISKYSPKAFAVIKEFIFDENFTTAFDETRFIVYW